MNPKYEISLTQYNYDTKQTENVGTVHIGTLARSITAEQMAKLLEDFLNGGRGDSPSAHRTIAQHFAATHRTLQASAVRFHLGIVSQYAKEYQKAWGEFTDPRNENAVRVAKKVSQMMEDEYIPFI